MTLKLSELVDMRELGQAIADGYVRERVHPEAEDLRIYNYAEKAQYERSWTDVTRTCRGLIVRGEEVIARPWPKFFNVGEHADGALDLGAPVEVSDKADGSLGILYPAPDGWAISTRGSFSSEQAQHATGVLRSRHLPSWSPDPAFTYLFEIVYPGNRIVLDYGRLDDLILLGARGVETGATFGPGFDDTWQGLRADEFEAPTLADALALKPRRNAEGLVIRYIDTGVMVKIKQDDYVALHRIVTGLSEKSVWEHLVEHGDYEGLLENVPDEFHGWVTEKAESLLSAHDTQVALAHEVFAQILDRLPEDPERGEFAAEAKQTNFAGLLFMLLDGRDISPAVWKGLRPRGQTYMNRPSEDVA